MNTSLTAAPRTASPGTSRGWWARTAPSRRTPLERHRGAAATALNIDTMQASALFSASNTIEDVRQIAELIAGGPL